MEIPWNRETKMMTAIRVYQLKKFTKKANQNEKKTKQKKREHET